MNRSIFSLESIISTVLVFHLLRVECSRQTRQIEHKVYACGDGLDQTCTKENYYGVFASAFSLITTCSNKHIRSSGMRVTNLINCVQLAQNSGAECHKNEQECKLCQCTARCVLQGLGVDSPDGSVNEPIMYELVDIMQHKIPEFKNFHFYWNACKQVAISGPPDPCERTFETLICIFNYNINKATEVTFRLITDLLLSQHLCGRSMNCTHYSPQDI